MTSEKPERSSAPRPPAGANWHPDPMRAHGAWIYLFTSIAAGALVGSERGVEPAMLAGTGFAGAFLVVAAIDAGPRRKVGQILLGAILAIVTSTIAIWLGARPIFFYVAALAAAPAATAVTLAKTRGVLSPATLIAGVAALTMSAPVAAMAGGSNAAQAAILFGLLWPFYSWRSVRVFSSLPQGGAWDRAALKARGMREALIVAAWTLAVAIVLRIA